MAKFKVGDKVRHVDDGQDGPVGVVKGVYGDGKIKVKFPGLMKDGFDGFEEEELVMANGCARNAKFKMGDQVLYRGVFGGRREDRIGTVRSEDSPGKYWIVFFDGSKMLVPETSLEAKNACAPRSSNAVVQNAINARRARNAIDFNGASAKVQKAFEGRIDKLVKKFKNDLRAVSTDVAKEYKKYQSIEPDSATLILEVGDWIESLKGSVDGSW